MMEVGVAIWGFFGVVIGIFATIRVANRNIEMKNITQERNKWREKIRVKALEVIAAYQAKDEKALIKLYVDFQVHLDPDDEDDRAILDTLKKMKEGVANKDIDETSIDELSKKLALLLKHDWERAKIEVKPIRYIISLIIDRDCANLKEWFKCKALKRISYDDLKKIQ